MASPGEVRGYALRRLLVGGRLNPLWIIDSAPNCLVSGQPLFGQWCSYGPAP